jgi:hypothetical protein
VRHKLEANTLNLGRLAQLLQRRYRRATARSFVMLAAHRSKPWHRNTDDVETQPIAVLPA